MDATVLVLGNAQSFLLRKLDRQLKSLSNLWWRRSDKASAMETAAADDQGVSE